VIGPTRTIAVLATAAIALASCSGGGSTASVAPHTTPSSGGRAQATITVKYTQGMHRLKSSATRRSPRFVDPYGSTVNVSSSSSTNPSFSTSTSIVVAPAADGSQTILAPIVSSPGPSDTTYIYVVEYDSSGDQLSTGQAYLSSVQPGTVVQAPPITLNMVVAGVAITTDTQVGGDLTPLSQNAASPTVWASCNILAGRASYLIPYDAANEYLLDPPTYVGLGGIPQAQVTSQVADNGGTSRISTDVNGGLHITFDPSGDGVNGTIQVFDIYGNLETTTYVYFQYPSC